MKALNTLFALFVFLVSLHSHAGTLAPVDVALTLAQTPASNGPKLDTLLLLEEQQQQIKAVNLSQHFNNQPDDPLSFVATHGYAALAQLAQQLPPVVVAKQALSLTPVLGNHHIAAGTNYLDHREEAGLDSGFLFPKLGWPTSSGADIKTGGEVLLDYEVELCLRFNHNIATMQDFETAVKGFSICGDMTDRAALIRNIDIDDVASGRGFTDGKSGDDRMPLGYYTVVAKDWRSFLSKVELRTEVNGKIRQQGFASSMVKDPQQLVADALQTGNDATWTYQQKAIPLLQDRKLSNTELLVTGTPAGVIFNDIPTSTLIAKGVKWVFTLGFLDYSAVDYVVEQTVSDALASGAYLKAGDQVLLSGTYLGEIALTVVN